MKASILTLGAVSLLTVGLAQPAFATERVVSVEFEAYELAHPDGRDAIVERIERAARQVCRAHGLMGLQARVISQECFEATYKEAMDELNSAVADARQSTSLRLAAYHVETQTRNG